MEILRHVVLLLHLIGFASLFGGFLVQMRAAQPEVNAAMLHGALTQLVTGIALIGLLQMAPEPGEGSINYVKFGIKLAFTLFIVVLVVKNRKFASIPRGVWALIGGLTLVNAGLAVLW